MRGFGSRNVPRLRLPLAGVVVGAGCLLLTGCGTGDWVQAVGAPHAQTETVSITTSRPELAQMPAPPQTLTADPTPTGPPSPTDSAGAAVPAENSAPAADASVPAPKPAAYPSAPTATRPVTADATPTEHDRATAAPTEPASPSAPDLVTPPPVTDPASPMTSAPVTSAPITSAPVTSAPITSAPTAGLPVCTPDQPAGTVQATPEPTFAGGASPAPTWTASPTPTPPAFTSAPMSTSSPTACLPGAASPILPGTASPILPGTSRTLAIYPFSATSPANRPLPASVTFESANGPMSGDLLAAGGTNVNSSSWSFAFYTATASDPVVQVKDPSSGAVRATIHLPANAATTGGTDDHMGVVQPDGYTGYEFYKMHNSGSGWTSPYVVRTDLRGDGLGGGTRASGTSIFWGVIRSQELQQASIRHTLLLGIPSSALKSGQVWPARLQDSFASRYSGSIPMGTLFAIPSSVDITSLGLDKEGTALARALQQYGAYAMIQSSSTALYAEKDADQSKVTALKGPWQTLRPLLRAVTNNRP